MVANASFSICAEWHSVFVIDLLAYVTALIYSVGQMPPSVGSPASIWHPFKQVSYWFGLFGEVWQELHLLVENAEKSPYVWDVFRFR